MGETPRMAIDFTFPPEIDDIRDRVRTFMDDEVRPLEAEADESGWERDEWIKAIIECRGKAKEAGLWLPHMPAEWGGMGLGHLEMEFDTSPGTSPDHDRPAPEPGAAKDPMSIQKLLKRFGIK